MEPTAIVLGCGPSGLLAAEGLERRGWRVRVLSRKAKSVLSGAQYLHHSINGLTNPQADGYLEYLKVGTKEGYAAKVYGSPAAECSWDLFPEGMLPAWSLQTAYDKLWEIWEHRIEEYVISDPEEVTYLQEQATLVLSTVPAYMTCFELEEHVFASQRIWVINGAAHGCNDDEIIYNGSDKELWYRTSKIFGYQSTEFTAPVEGGEPGYKPLNTNCDCHPWMRRAGRFGKWRKGILVHHVWEEVNSALYELP